MGHHKVTAKINDDADPEQFTVYNINVETNMEIFGKNQSFTVQKRYKEFKHLYKALALDYPNLPKPFPKKKAFSRFKDNVVEGRREFFDRLVRHIANDPTLKTSRIVLKFLGY